MKIVTTAPTDLLLKAFDIELKKRLQEDMQAVRAKPIRKGKLAA